MQSDLNMHHLIHATGLATLGSVAAIATITAAAINPIGAALLLTGAILWGKKNR